MKFQIVDDSTPWKFNFGDMPEPEPQPQIVYDETKINVVKYDENMQLMPESLEYYDTLEDAWYDVEYSENPCHIHIGSSSSEVPFIQCDLYFISNLLSIDIPEGVTSFPESFLGSTNIQNLTIPASVISIGDDICIDCEYLQSIEVAYGNTAYVSEHGVLFNASKTKLIRYPSGNTRTRYTIPNGVTEILPNAFSKAISLEHITIPDSVTSIGYYAFIGCYLDWLAIPEGVQRIEEGLVTQADVVEIPHSVYYIDSSAFAACGEAMTININRVKDSIKGAPWGAYLAVVNWTG